MTRPTTSTTARQALLPNSANSTLGILGGGQLGRMFAQAAQSMGYQVVVLEAEQNCPTSQVTREHIAADYQDQQALSRLASQTSRFTTEFENVPADSLRWLAQHGFVAPAADCVAVAQNRLDEKLFFTECAVQSKVMPAPHAAILNLDDATQVKSDLFPGILKTARMGYDGKGQVRVSNVSELIDAFKNLNEQACVLEKMLDLDYEVSVLVARGVDGEAVVYPIAENLHRNGILHTTIVPSPRLCAEIAKQAQDAALQYIQALGYVGVLCIEFFVLKDGSLVVNEMAPRPHNSGHYTIDACRTSQFEQQVRALAQLPLGDVSLHSPTAMLNLLGDLWFADINDLSQVRDPNWEAILAIPGAHLHLYGKAEARPARKMGHLTLTASSMDLVLARLAHACQILGLEHAA